jgi:UDP-glucose 4-epimerase
MLVSTTMRILVTGGAGFIGSHVADAALAAGHEVVVIDDLSSGKRQNVPEKATFEQIDIRNASALDTLIGRFKPEVISHQAAQTSVSVSTREPVRDAEINIVGSINLCTSAVTHKVGRVVFASTGGAIYGEVPEGTRAREEHPTTPLSPYACSKLGVESYLRYFRHEFALQSTILRYANVYGPRQDPHGEAGVVAIFAQRLKAKQPIQINAMKAENDGGCIRDYVFVEDVVRANMAAIDGKIGIPIINVCTGHATNTKMIADELQRELGTATEIRQGPRRAGDLERSVLDPTRLIELLGKPTVLADGLKKTSAWFATH